MGYVVERRGRWYAVGYEGQDVLTGRDRRRWHPAMDEAAARALAASLPPASAAGRKHGVTVARFLRCEWLPSRRDLLRPTTLFRYEAMTERYVVPHIGRVPVRRLTTADLQGLYDHLRVAGSATGGPLSPKTVLNVHQILRAALGDAQRREFVGRNVAALMGPPCHGGAPEQRCWNDTELRTFLEASSSHRLAAALRLAAMTGMRRGEVLGVEWRDLDVAARRLSVRRSVTCTGYETHVNSTKTDTSRRVIDLDDRTVEVLVEWRARQATELDGRTASVMFSRPNGCRVHPHLLSQTFERIQSRLEVPRIRFHDLRHTHATLLPKAGMPLKVVSERLGHSTPAFTMTVYQHVLPGMQRDAADLFSRLVDGVVSVDGR